MLVALIPVFAQIIDLVVTALTKHPEYAPHLGPVLTNTIAAMSQAAGETPEQTATRRAAAEAIFAKQSQPIVPVPLAAGSGGTK